MGWVYLDDKFPDNEKIQLAGGDAGWVWACGLAYCNRNTTGGRIPKAAVSQLTDRRAPAKLAAKLVTVGLWEDEGDYYRVHGYDEWQRSAVSEHEARVAKAEKAAKARWDRERAKRDAKSNAQASPEHEPEQCSDHASRAGVPNPSPSPPKDVLVSYPVTPKLDAPESADVIPISRKEGLAARLYACCVSPRRTQIEAIGVVAMCLEHADWRTVDEAIGLCEVLHPKYPRYLLPTFRDHAARSGITVPDLEWKLTS